MVVKGRINYLIKSSLKEFTKKEEAIKYCNFNNIPQEEIIRFDSRTEKDYYLYLLKDSEVKNIQLQKQFLLQDKFTTANGYECQPIFYTADFVYEKNGKLEIVDVKSAPYLLDERFKVIKKLFDNKYREEGLYLKIVVRNGNRKGFEEHNMYIIKKLKTIEKQREKIKELEEQIKELEKNGRIK